LTTTRIDRLFAGALILLGLYVVRNALEYGYMRGATPGPGFFPFWIGLALAGVSAINLVRSAIGSERLDALFDRSGFLKALAILTAVVAFILATPWIGLLTGAAVLIPIIAFVIRPRWTPSFAATILAITFTFPIACHYLFAVYLQVPMIEGPFGF
jgi:hypothetical protein